MSNKIRNTEAVRIHRPIALGQVRDEVEACVYALVEIIFGENLLPAAKVPMWRAA